jgi:hypothetical protein
MNLLVLFCCRYNEEGECEDIDEINQLHMKGPKYRKIYFELACSIDFNDYKPMIKENEEDTYQVNKIFNELECSTGTELLEKLLIMANRLLDYKFWSREIKKYRKF